MSRVVGVPTYLADVIVAVALIAMLVATMLARYRIRRSAATSAGRCRARGGDFGGARCGTRGSVATAALDARAISVKPRCFGTATFWVAVLRIATPLIFGTLGVLLCERSGVLNLGIEGIMAAGAFSGWLAVHSGQGLWAGLAVAALVGVVFGLLHGWLTVTLALSQHVSGLGITLLATSLAHYSYRVTFPTVTTPPTITPFAPLGRAARR